MITEAQSRLFDQLMRDGATVIEATQVVQLASEIDVIELSWKDAWKAEKRDAHGRFASGGGGAPDPVARALKGAKPEPRVRAAGVQEVRWSQLRSVYQGGGVAPGVRIVPGTTPLTHLPSAEPRAPRMMRTSTGRPEIPAMPDVSELSSFADVQRAMEQMKSSTTKALVDMSAYAAKHENEKAEARANWLLLQQRHTEQQRLHTKTTHKAAVEIGISLGGLILAIVEGMIGAPGLSQILAAAGPPVVQAIVEWRKRL